jgi:hypothetical protein
MPNKQQLLATLDEDFSQDFDRADQAEINIPRADGGFVIEAMDGNVDATTEPQFAQTLVLRRLL